MTPRWTSSLTGSTVYEADARVVAASMPDGVASLAILDGPYGMSKADWDRVPRGGTLGDLYAGHLDDVGRVCGASASLYLWNTSAGWAELHPLVLARGWVFRSLIVWSKPATAAMKGATDGGVRAWVETAEYCGFYQRESWTPSTGRGGRDVGDAAGRDDRNWIRAWLAEGWEAAGLRRWQADEAQGTNSMASHYFSTNQWLLPTWNAYQMLAKYANERGRPRERPYLVHPAKWPNGGIAESYQHLRASYDHLMAEYAHLRDEYEACRPAFVNPPGISNIWELPQVSGKDRLVDADGRTLHPCQKPLLFAERMIRASSRPGDTVWVPFGGTLRELVAAERIARADPGEARRVVTCEINADGRDYIGAALAQIEGRPVGRTGQVGLFGGGR